MAITAFLLANDRFQIAAPEGFSACCSAPAHTIFEVAVSQPGLLVSIVAIIEQIGEYYAINQANGQFVSSQLSAKCIEQFNSLQRHKWYEYLIIKMRNRLMHRFLSSLV